LGGILGYARVSTSDQDVAGQSARLTQAGAIRVFTDVRSGKSMDRPGLHELLAFAREGDALAIVRLDRLGRSLSELLTIVEQLKERRISLMSLEEKIDTSSAAGELIFHVFGAIAHFERRLIAERTKDGIAAARARASCRDGDRSTPRRPRRRSSWSSPGCRRQRPRASSGLDAPPYIVKWRWWVCVEQPE